MRLYNSLEDFLISKELSIDKEDMPDGWGAYFPLKGREIEATILFCDITSFSKETESLSSTETMLFVNKFIAWISAEGLSGTSGIIDKYIGDEILVVFSNEFGSSDHFMDAINTAKRFGEFDEWGFRPHIGLASGIVTVGYTGTPLKFSCTVFGRPVTVAARCAAVNIHEAEGVRIVFPAHLFRDYKFENIFTPIVYQGVDSGRKSSRPTMWQMLSPQTIIQKSDKIEVLPIINNVRHIVTSIDSDISFAGVTNAAEVVKQEIQLLLNQGKYRPRNKGEGSKKR